MRLTCFEKVVLVFLDNIILFTGPNTDKLLFFIISMRECSLSITFFYLSKVHIGRPSILNDWWAPRTIGWLMAINNSYSDTNSSTKAKSQALNKVSYTLSDYTGPLSSRTKHAFLFPFLSSSKNPLCKMAMLLRMKSLALCQILFLQFM